MTNGVETRDPRTATGRIIAMTESTYRYPLIFRQLWHAPLRRSSDQEIDGGRSIRR